MKAANLLALLALAGCAAPPPGPPPAAVTDAARDYHTCSKVNTDPNWAPTLCAPPPMPPPLLSVSRDPDTHGRKLYYLFSKDQRAYLQSKDRPQPVGQVIVKEAWFPKAGADPKQKITGEKGPLFLMIKTGDADSDEGWIYATATPDGKTITSWGKLASCMECHQVRTNDRMFGLKSCASPD